MIKQLLCAYAVVLTGLAGASAAVASDVEGTWQNQPYDFTFWTSDIDGTWGAKSYDLSLWTSDFNGIVASSSLSIDLWPSDIDGTLPCGPVAIDIWSNEVSGTLCGSQFQQDASSQSDARRQAFDLVVAALLDDFPLPARSAIAGRFRQHYAAYLDQN